MNRLQADPSRQDGVALMMALVFLIVITLIALSSMRGSTLELKMAGNEQMRVQAVQSAQTAIDKVSNIENFPVFKVGYTICFNKTEPHDADKGKVCDKQGDTLDDPEYANNGVEIRLLADGAFTCRACQTSANKFNAAQFSMLSDYQNDTMGGRARIEQGMLLMVPTGN